MIDSSLMPELPDAMFNLRFGYDSVQMKAYGLQCYQLAMERAAQEVEGDRPVTKEAGGRVEIGGGARRAIAAAIRALALQEKTDTASPEEGTS